MVAILRFANVFLAGLIAGTLFGIWLGFNPGSLSPSTYIEQQQNAIRALNVTMPVLGAICIVLTLAHSYVTRSNRSVMYVLLAAAGLFVISGVVTRFGNQPINAIVMGWQPSTPPAFWSNLRDRWWQLHLVRTVTAVAGFGCVISASMQRLPSA